MRPMRRKDREITDKKAIEDFIQEQQILRVAFYDEGDIYIVPVNYGYSYDENYTFYFHGAKAGRKYELAKLNPKVGFEIDGKYSLVDGELACDYTAHFQSVIGKEARKQILQFERKLPKALVACVGGGSNSAGMFSGFLNDPVDIYGVEPLGRGKELGNHAASLNYGEEGIMHGFKSLMLKLIVIC